MPFDKRASLQQIEAIYSTKWTYNKRMHLLFETIG